MVLTVMIVLSNMQISRIFLGQKYGDAKWRRNDEEAKGYSNVMTCNRLKLGVPPSLIKLWLNSILNW